MKRLIVIAIGIIFLTSLAYAGGVVDNNNGSTGDILVATGENNGANSVGTWTNPTDIPTLKGEKGDKGEQGITGTGEQGERGLRGYRGYTGKGLKDQYKVGVELRIVDTKHTTWATYYNRDLNNKSNEVGIKCTIKLGKDYLDRKLEELERRVEEQESIVGTRADWERIYNKYFKETTL